MRLAVTTAKRFAQLPDLPAVAEFLPGYEATGWLGIGAPRDTPNGIVERFDGEINAAIADPAIGVRFAAMGIEPTPIAAADFGKFIAAGTDKWAKVVAVAHVKPN